MDGSDAALIHLRVPAVIKARWVRESRAARMRLTDWIVERVEAQAMKKTTTPIFTIIPVGPPTPDAIRAARAAACLTQTAAAQLVHGTMRAWQDWEAGARRMHPGLWELFLLKISNCQ